MGYGEALRQDIEFRRGLCARNAGHQPSGNREPVVNARSASGNTRHQLLEIA